MHEKLSNIFFAGKGFFYQFCFSDPPSPIYNPDCRFVFIENKAMVWCKKYGDQKFSVADCVSFECMKMFGIEKILTFDIDFKIAGFTIVNNAGNL